MANYINNAVLYKLLVDYRTTGSRKAYNEIGKGFILIARNYLNRSFFINYTEDRKQEMISDAVYYMCRFIDRYDLKQINPFAYFTTFAQNAFLQYLNERNKIDAVFTPTEYIENFNDSDYSDDIISEKE